MTQQPLDNNATPAGSDGNSATIAWSEKKADAPAAAEANVANSADSTLDQIDKLIGRIHSTSATTPLTPRPTATMPLTATTPLTSTTPLTTTTPLTAPNDPQVHKSEPHDDAALQDYMDQFLERVTGSKKKPEPEGSTASSAALSAPPASPEPERLREAKRAPESIRDMSAMRALANDSARRALGAHAGQLIARTRNSFLGALSLSLISSLLALASLMAPLGWTWITAVLVMLPALVLTGRYLLLRGQLKKLIRPTAA